MTAFNRYYTSFSRFPIELHRFDCSTTGKQLQILIVYNFFFVRLLRGGDFPFPCFVNRRQQHLGKPFDLLIRQRTFIMDRF